VPFFQTVKTYNMPAGHSSFMHWRKFIDSYVLRALKKITCLSRDYFCNNYYISYYLNSCLKFCTSQSLKLYSTLFFQGSFGYLFKVVVIWTPYNFCILSTKPAQSKCFLTCLTALRLWLSPLARYLAKQLLLNFSNCYIYIRYES
jgi:hypothetical protein